MSVFIEGVSLVDLKQFMQDEIRTVIAETLQTAVGHVSSEHNMANEHLYTRKEAAAKLRISLPTLGQFSKNGTIKAHRVGTRVRYTEQSIQDALKEMNSVRYRKR